MGKTKKLKSGDIAPEFSIEDAGGKMFSLADYKGEKKVVLSFHRYAGCPICQLAMAQMKSAYGEFESRGAEVAIFVQSPRETLESQGGADMFPFRLIPDENGTIYEMYGVGSGGLGALIAPKTIRMALKATFDGHKQGKMEGNTWQLPGDFIVDTDGTLLLARVGDNMGDNLTPEKLLSYIK